MFIATTTKQTWHIINTIVLVFCLGRKQCNEDKQYMPKICFISITYINKTTTINYLHIDKNFITYKNIILNLY